MKQIRLVKRTKIIESCYDCPCVDDDFMVCNISNEIGIPDIGIRPDCPLEDAE